MTHLEQVRADITLELIALRCLFYDGDGQLMSSLVAEDFSVREYREVFECCLQLVAKGSKSDFCTVCLKMNSVDWWNRIGGSSWFAGLFINDLPYKPAHTIAQCLRELTILRMQEKLKLESGDVQENISELERARDSYLGLMPSKSKSMKDWKHIILQEDDDGMSSGFNGIDALTGGMENGQFIVVGARTGVGKSVYLMNVAAHVAKQGKSVMWFALEMSEKEVAKRFAKLLDEKGRADSLDYLETLDIVSGSRTIPQIESEVMRKDYDLVIVDYIQICRSGTKQSTEVQELQEITRRLKMLAMGHNTVVLSAAQLNRDMEKGSGEPKLHHLRGSGSIEQDADVVLLIHRIEDENTAMKKGKNLGVDHIAHSWSDRGDTTVFVEKNRNGRTGIVNMDFDDKRLRFVSKKI